MDDAALRDALRSLPAPDAAAAQARSRELVRAAHAGRRPARHRSRRPRWAAGAIAGAVAICVALTAAQGAPLGRWVRDALRSSGGQRSAELVTLPGGGRLLVSTGRGAWIAGQGVTRAVGHTGGVVSWSAFGRYVACACGDSLQAVALNGRVAWRERFTAHVNTPTWSPDGNRIAFGVGHELHVTAGDGTGARVVRAGGHASAVLGLASWRPGTGHELAVHDAVGRVSLIDTDRDRYVTHVKIGRHAVSVTWSADGRRLLAASQQTARVYDAGGRVVASEHAPAGAVIRAAALAPSGREIAFLLSERGGRQEALLRTVGGGRPDRVLLAGGQLGDLQFSPDGRWLLVGWRDLDSWIFFTTAAGPTEVRQIGHVARRLGDGEPVVAAWCCAAPPR
jgi:dipeptidyl aminopeptidase/acylaminoacyl peptidase